MKKNEATAAAEFASIPLAIDEVASARERLDKARADARSGAFRAFAATQRALLVALGGSDLRGMPRLYSDYVGGEEKRFYGMRLRGELRATPILPVEQEIFVLASSGTLEAVKVTGTGTNKHEPVSLGDDCPLLLEDLGLYLFLLTEVLDRHLRLSEEAAVRYESVADLAGKILGVLGAGKEK